MRRRGACSFTHEAHAIVRLVFLDEIHNVSVFHQRRDDRNQRGREHDAYKRQDILVLKPPPADHFSDEELTPSVNDLLGSSGSENLPYTPSRDPL